MLLRLCWRCGLELRGRVQLQLLGPELVQLVLLLLVLLLLLLLLQRVLLLPLL